MSDHETIGERLAFVGNVLFRLPYLLSIPDGREALQLYVYCQIKVVACWCERGGWMAREVMLRCLLFLLSGHWRSIRERENVSGTGR